MIEDTLAQKLSDLQAQVRQAWKGQERQGIVEIVRSADLAAFIVRFLATDIEQIDRQRPILSGVAPALATLLPAINDSGGGLPFAPASDELANWVDGMLCEFGKLAELQRFAAFERHGLCRCEQIGPQTFEMVLPCDVAESMDRDAAQWLSTETERRVSALRRSQLDKQGVADLLDLTSGVQDNWMIRYDGHEELIEYFREAALVEVLGCSESEALPEAAEIGGRSFAEWRGVCVAALGRVFNHIAYATRLRHRNPSLTLRNLLTIPVLKDDAVAVWLEAGEDAERVRTTMSALTVDADTIKPWQEDHEIPAPFYIDVGREWFLLPLFGGLLNPVCGLVRTLRLQHRTDWDKAVGKREADFRRDLQDLFRPPRFLVPDNGFVLRRPDGSRITDVDAAILDRETGTLALVQLKWPDIFGLSPNMRESRRRNLLSANDWVDRVSNWIDGRDARAVSKALGLSAESSNRPPVTLVIPRYSARFTLNEKFDDRAGWMAWAEVVRLRVEEDNLADPLMELFQRFRSGGEIPPYELPEDTVYRLKDLEVRVRVA